MAWGCPAQVALPGCGGSHGKGLDIQGVDLKQTAARFLELGEEKPRWPRRSHGSPHKTWHLPLHSLVGTGCAGSSAWGSVRLETRLGRGGDSEDTDRQRAQLVVRSLCPGESWPRTYSGKVPPRLPLVHVAQRSVSLAGSDLGLRQCCFPLWGMGTRMPSRWAAEMVK